MERGGNSVFSEEKWLDVSAKLKLSPRQSQIIWFLFSGLSDKEIAKQLGITVPTVRTHLSRIFAKFSLDGRQQLLLHVFQTYLSQEKDIANAS